MGKKDSFAMRAAMVQNLLKDNGEVQRPHLAAYEVVKGLGPLKREVVIDKVATGLNMDKTAVAGSIGNWLTKMKKDGLAENVKYGYWSFN